MRSKEFFLDTTQFGGHKNIWAGTVPKCNPVVTGLSYDLHSIAIRSKGSQRLSFFNLRKISITSHKKRHELALIKLSGDYLFLCSDYTN